MSNILQEVLAANQRYAADFGDKAKLAMPPARRFAILTCMDARLDPAKFADHRQPHRIIAAHGNEWIEFASVMARDGFVFGKRAIPETGECMRQVSGSRATDA